MDKQNNYEYLLSHDADRKINGSLINITAREKKKITQLMMLTGQLGSQCSMAQKSTGILKETDFVDRQTLLSTLNSWCWQDNLTAYVSKKERIRKIRENNNYISKALKPVVQKLFKLL